MFQRDKLSIFSYLIVELRMLRINLPRGLFAKTIQIINRTHKFHQIHRSKLSKMAAPVFYPSSAGHQSRRFPNDVNRMLKTEIFMRSLGHVLYVDDFIGQFLLRERCNSSLRTLPNEPECRIVGKMINLGMFTGKIFFLPLERPDEHDFRLYNTRSFL